MKTSHKTISILILLFVIFLIGCSQDKVNCTKSGGKWIGFSHSGADICDQQGIGADIITHSCDCGPNKCWDRNQCVKEESND